MTKEKKDSALVFVGQIMTAYKAAMRVEGEALKAAIECGKYLNLAKENVKADKGKWLAWLKQNCREISQQTASLYMRLADPENLDKLVGVKTIRDADKALRLEPISDALSILEAKRANMEGSFSSKDADKNYAPEFRVSTAYLLGDVMCIEESKRSQRDTKRLADVMRTLGWQLAQYPIKVGKRTRRAYYKPQPPREG